MAVSRGSLLLATTLALCMLCVAHVGAVGLSSGPLEATSRQWFGAQDGDVGSESVVLGEDEAAHVKPAAGTSLVPKAGMIVELTYSRSGKSCAGPHTICDQDTKTPYRVLDAGCGFIALVGGADKYEGAASAFRLL